MYHPIESEQEYIKSYVAYAASAPWYSNIYADCRFGKSPEIKGSIVTISGGYYRPARPDSNERPMIYQAGVLDDVPPQCRRFTEKVVAKLVGPEEIVTILYYISRKQTAAWIDTLRDNDIEVISTGDVEPDCDSAYAICSGTGEMLSKLNWLEQVVGSDPLFVMASSDAESILIDQLTYASRIGVSPVSIIRAFQDETERRPDTAIKELGDYNLFAFLVGPDASSLVINRQSTDVDCLHSVFRTVATNESITLFYAGGVCNQRKGEKAFTEFDGWLEWKTPPTNWEQVI